MMIQKPKISHILFATDLSENANRAFDYAVSLAESCNAAVTVIHVFEKLPPNTDPILVAFLGYRDVDELREKSEANLIERIKTTIEQFCAQTSEQIPTCSLIFREVLVETGNPAERILHHAGTGNYDILVMGNRGLGLIQATLMGSISRKVLQSSPIPVLVVPMAMESNSNRIQSRSRLAPPFFEA
jgi:nucleotide-binding universal stress UspA family protein